MFRRCRRGRGPPRRERPFPSGVHRRRATAGRSAAGVWNGSDSPSRLSMAGRGLNPVGTHAVRQIGHCKNRDLRLVVMVQALRPASIDPLIQATFRGSAVGMWPATASRVAQASTASEPRCPAHQVLHQIVLEHVETFGVQAASLRDGEGLPGFVEREFRDFLTCECLAGGFARFHCDQCGQDRLVPFSRKGRGFCPSCGGRRPPCAGSARRTSLKSTRQESCSGCSTATRRCENASPRRRPSASGRPAFQIALACSEEVWSPQRTRRTQSINLQLSERVRVA